MRLQGKRVLITGGGQGLGKGMARRFLAEGCRVLIAEHDPQAGEMAIRELASCGEIHYVGTDVG
jgi:NAD(P)-dependent dehydrogenase (short-subunit alcohol dehydrogenase family)